MEEKKLVVQFELDKTTVESLMYLMGDKLPSELWEKLTEKPLEVSSNILGDETKAQLELLVMSCAMMKVGK